MGFNKRVKRKLEREKNLRGKKRKRRKWNLESRKMQKKKMSEKNILKGMRKKMLRNG